MKRWLMCTGGGLVFMVLLASFALLVETAARAGFREDYAVMASCVFVGMPLVLGTGMWLVTAAADMLNGE